MHGTPFRESAISSSIVQMPFVSLAEVRILKRSELKLINSKVGAWPCHRSGLQASE